MIKAVIDRLLKPVVVEMPFFFMMVLLLDYWAIFQLLKNPVDEFGYSFLQFFSISVVYSYVFTCIVALTRSFILKYSLYMFGVFLVAIDIFHYFLSHNTLLTSTSLLLVLETNLSEVKGFCANYLMSRQGLLVIILFLILLAVCVWLDSRRRLFAHWVERMHDSFRCILGLLLTLLLLCGLCSFRSYLALAQCNTLESLNEYNADYNHNSDRITNLFFCFKSIQVLGEKLPRSLEVTKKSMETDCKLLYSGDSVNVVLVIGESFIKKHSSLYGYGLETNPVLKRELKNGRLWAFKDVVSPNMHTFDAIRNMMSTNSVGDGETWENHPYFPAIFHRVGYYTLFWDNQDDSGLLVPPSFALDSYLHGEDISQMSYDAQHPQVSMYDHELIDNFRDYWEKNGYRKHNFVMFHLQGQHFSVEDRYPQIEAFNRFNADSIHRSEEYLTIEKKQEIAHYDNCTLYNDSVIGRIISIFKDKPTVMIYLSDHGENLYDKGDWKGRINDDIQMYEIPFFVWCSEKYIKQHPDVVKSIRDSFNKPLMSDNLCHLLFRLGGVDSEYYNETRDVLSNSYKCPPRIVAGKVNYGEKRQKLR